MLGEGALPAVSRIVVEKVDQCCQNEDFRQVVEGVEDVNPGVQWLGWGGEGLGVTISTLLSSLKLN